MIRSPLAVKGGKSSYKLSEVLGHNLESKFNENPKAVDFRYFNFMRQNAPT